jgi:hypothetical protein
MNDKIAYINQGFRGATGMPVNCSFVASESADFSAREDGKSGFVGTSCEKSDRSLATKVEAVSKQSVTGSFKSWLVRTLETSFAHPYI